MVTTSQWITRTEDVIGHVFTNKSLCAEALQMEGPESAFVIENRLVKIDHNKRLQIFGLSFIEMKLCDSWYEGANDNNMPLSPADWTAMRNDWLGNRNLAERGFEIGLESCIVKVDGCVPSEKMVAATVSALIGAVFRDAGDEAAEKVLDNMGIYLKDV